MPDDRSEKVERGELMSDMIRITLRNTPEWPVPVRPVLDDLVGGWMPDIEEGLLKCRGSVVGVSGKDTLVTASIASTVAAWVGGRGRQVTLIDASLETPVIAKALLDDGDEGIVDAVLFGVSTSIVARRTLATNVTLVTPGSMPMSTSRVLGTDAFRVVLDKLARDGALVLVVLPQESLGRALWFLDAVVAIGRTAEEISSVEDAIAHSVRQEEVDVVRLLVSLPGVASSEERRILIDETHAAEDYPAPTGASDTVASTEAASGHVASDEVSSGHVASDEAAPADTDSGVTSALASAPEPAETQVTRDRGRRNRWIAPVIVVLVVASLGTAWRYGVFENREAATPADSDRHPTRVTPAASDLSDSEGERQPAEPVREATQSDAGKAESGPAASRTSGGLHVSQPGGDEALSGWPPATVGLYVVFTSSHRYETAAHYDMEALLALSLPAVIVAVELDESGVWYRVAVDAGFETVSEASDLLETVRELGYEGAWVRRLRQPTTDMDSDE